MDEEKTIDEAVDEKAIDEAVDESVDEMKEFEPVAFDEVIKDEPVKESAPVLRDGGDPEPADMNMIHKHVDNFLAKIAGETPIDDNVRDSTEYWLDRIANGGGDVGTIPRVKLIWTNETPTSVFAEQTINLDLSIYDYVIVLIAFTNSSASTLQTASIVPVGVSGTAQGMSGSGLAIRTYQTGNTGITFANARAWTFNSEASVESNTNAIPRYIFGIKI